MLYIFWFLHQTTTFPHTHWIWSSCISFDSYIKPQLCLVISRLIVVVYLLIPTSNHNFYLLFYSSSLLYIFWFLHQTTTSMPNLPSSTQLYIFWFLHQTTTGACCGRSRSSCISFDSYIKPQLMYCFCFHDAVVYLLIPTSNHNPHPLDEERPQLYIFWFLHQTTTWQAYLSISLQLYIFWFLHQTTTSLMGMRGSG